MDRLRITYALTSIAFLLILAISPLKDFFRDWRGVQKNYNQLIERLPQRVKPIPIALQQVWARDLGRVDRCVTCHLGATNPKLVNAPQPYRTHPRIPHEIEKFGCTICHGGQGLATEFADAHLPSEFWDQPVLPIRYLESSCARCHINEPLELTPTINRGRELITELNCAGCHRIPGFKKIFVPALDGIGNKVTGRNWLVRWLKNPQEIRPNTRMPNFLLSDEEAEILADFLMSFKNFPEDQRLDSLPPVYWQNKDDEAFIALGKTRFREARCVSCHTVEGRGGTLAPELAKIASKATASWIFNYLKNPKRLQPCVEMPQYGFTEKEVAAITAYIESEFIEWDAPEEESGEHQPVPNFFERGLTLFNQYNCGGCHRLSSPKIIENRGPDLTAIGSKKIYQIDFGNADIPHTLYHYIDAKLKIPRAFGENTRMPLYRLSDSDRQAITSVLLSFKDEPLPLKFVHLTSSREKFEPQGKVGKIFKKYSCLKCHTIRGTGGKIAPDLSYIGSQLQQNWVRQYFRVPYSLRPIVRERMPNLFISNDEIEILANYFYTSLLNDQFTIPGDWTPTPGAIERGRGLFWEKYGCQSCHIVGGKGGYVGPPLDNVGTRLQPGWIFHWLMNPQKYKPGTVEPRSGMSDDEAKDIIAYLFSLRRENMP